MYPPILHDVLQSYVQLTWHEHSLLKRDLHLPKGNWNCWWTDHEVFFGLVSHSLLILQVYHHTTLFLFGNFTSFISHFPLFISFSHSLSFCLSRFFLLLYFIYFFDLASLFFRCLFSFFFFFFFHFLNKSCDLCIAFDLLEVIVTAWVFGGWRITIWYHHLLTSWCARDTHWDIVLLWCTLLMDEG